MLELVAESPYFDDWLEGIVRQLFSVTFCEDIRCGWQVVVLFLGDTAQCFSWAKAFYAMFMAMWDDIFTKQLLAERAEHGRALQDAQAKYDSLGRKCKRVDKELALSLVMREERAIARYDEQLANISTVAHKNVFVTLGNHELWDFSSYQDAIVAYDEMLSLLNIRLFDRHVCFEIPAFLGKKPLILAGFCGCGAYSDMNADCGIYRGAMDRNEELRVAEVCSDTYKKLLSYAREQQAVVVFCTHFPVEYWFGEAPIADNVTYFSGHTHDGYEGYIGGDSFVFANNQVGYHNRSFGLKKVLLCNRYNPFSSLADGLHETSVDNYWLFSMYIGEPISVNTVAKYVLQYGCKLYVAKSDDYYGFFLLSDKKAYICNGGRPNKLPHYVSVDGLFNEFKYVLKAYQKVFSGLRAAQEHIAGIIQQIGGSGRIHGTIVDIDFCSHIMINPTTAELQFYYSPMFGEWAEYDDLLGLLSNRLPELAVKYQELLDSNDTSLMVLSKNSISTVDSSLHYVPTGRDGGYGASRYMAPIQRLFSGHVLRVWDDVVVKKVLQESDDLLDEGGKVLMDKIPLDYASWDTFSDEEIRNLSADEFCKCFNRVKVRRDGFLDALYFPDSSRVTEVVDSDVVKHFVSMLSVNVLQNSKVIKRWIKSDDYSFLEYYPVEFLTVDILRQMRLSTIVDCFDELPADMLTMSFLGKPEFYIDEAYFVDDDLQVVRHMLTYFCFRKVAGYKNFTEKTLRKEFGKRKPMLDLWCKALAYWDEHLSNI